MAACAPSPSVPKLSPTCTELQQDDATDSMSTTDDLSPETSPKTPSTTLVKITELDHLHSNPSTSPWLVDLETAPHSAEQNLNTHGIHWKSPAFMLFCFACGILFSVGHGVNYGFRNNHIVNTANLQEINTRVGSFFALMTQLSYTGSTWLAYYQWLWRAMRDRPIALGVLDDGFAVESSFVAMLNPVLAKNVKVGYSLAVIAWCLQVPSLITPATLSVAPSTDTSSVLGLVRVVAINIPSEWNRFAYSTPIQNNTSIDESERINYVVFSGARSIIKTIASAVASSGKISDLPPPFNQSSYSISFNGPHVSCQPANVTSMALVDAFIAQKLTVLQGTYRQTQNAYTAFVPSLEATSDPSDTVTVGENTITGNTKMRMQQPGNGTNELWLSYWRYKKDEKENFLRDPDNAKIAERHYTVCQLYNATYDVTLLFDDGVQTVTKNNIDTTAGVVSFPEDSIDRPSNKTQHAYSAIFWALADQIVGSMGLYNNTRPNSTEAPAFSFIDALMAETVLLGSDDLDYFFDLNEVLYANSTNETLSDQRVLDKAVVKGQTLDILIEDLMFNITMSLPSNHLLSQNQTVQISHSIPVNRFAFNWPNFVIANGLASVFALLAVLLGFLAYRRNGAAHDNKISTIISISCHNEFKTRIPPCAQGQLPLPKETLNTQVQLIPEDGSALLLRPQGEDVTPVCNTCARMQDSHERRRSSIWTRRKGLMGVNSARTTRVQKRRWSIAGREPGRSTSLVEVDPGKHAASVAVASIHPALGDT